jgi:hypothetical protein
MCCCFYDHPIYVYLLASGALAAAPIMGLRVAL